MWIFDETNLGAVYGNSAPRIFAPPNYAPGIKSTLHESEKLTTYGTYNYNTSPLVPQQLEEEGSGIRLGDFVNLVTHSDRFGELQSYQLPLTGGIDIHAFNLHGLNFLDDVGRFPFNIDAISQLHANRRDLYHRHLYLGKIVRNFTDFR